MTTAEPVNSGEFGMKYVLTGGVNAIVGQECRESLAGVTVRLYRPAGTAPVAFRLLTEREVEARAGRWLGDAVTDDRGRFRLDLDTAAVAYDGGPVEVGLRLRSPLRPLPATPPARSVQCVLTTLTPAWEQVGEVARTDWLYAVPAPAWAQVRAHFGAYVIVGRLSASDGVTPIVGARVKAFDVDLIGDEPLGTGVTDEDGWFRIDYPRAAFQQPAWEPELGSADV